MRNLVIKRREAFFNRRKAMEVYICEPEGEYEIHGNACRKLGRLDNGDVISFPVDNAAAKIYILPEGADEDDPCEYCFLPEGNSDIFLSGSCQFSPFAGHPFHFDGGDNSLAVKQRRKALLLILAGLVAAVVLGVIGGKIISNIASNHRNGTPETFHYDGMQITLTEDFQLVDVSNLGFNTGYASTDTSVFVLKEAFSDEAGLENLSVETYAQLVIDSNPKLAGNTATQEEGLTIFEYTAVSPVDGESYTYMVAFFKGPDGFWMIEFSSTEDMFPDMRQTYLNYAASVCFTNNAI